MTRDRSSWRTIAENALAVLTRDEVARMVAKASENPRVTPGLALKLDIIGRHKPLRAEQAKRAEGFDRLRKEHGRQALAELGVNYFIESRRMAASPSEPGPHRRRQMKVIGGYLIVAHETHNGWYAHPVTHALKDFAAAERHVRARSAELDRKYSSDEYLPVTDTMMLNRKEHPTLHAVSPKLFAKVHERREYLAINDYYYGFALELGGAINRHTQGARYPYTYKVGATEVFATKSEWLALGNREAERPAAGRVPGGLISRFSR